MRIDKIALRAEMRVARSRYAATVPGALDGTGVLARFAGAMVASYRPIGGEIDPGAIDSAIAASGGTLAYPRVEGAGVMRFLRPMAHADWEDGPYGIIQPRSHCAAITPALVIVPLLAFDRSGHRLGQGGGYYDRALAALPRAFKLGVAWSVQEIDRVPVEPWDVRLDAILTEQQWIEP